MRRSIVYWNMLVDYLDKCTASNSGFIRILTVPTKRDVQRVCLHVKPGIGTKYSLSPISVVLLLHVYTPCPFCCTTQDKHVEQTNHRSSQPSKNVNIINTCRKDFFVLSPACQFVFYANLAILHFYSLYSQILLFLFIIFLYFFNITWSSPFSW